MRGIAWPLVALLSTAIGILLGVRIGRLDDRPRPSFRDFDPADYAGA